MWDAEKHVDTSYFREKDIKREESEERNVL